jgi:4-amino-4-deoxy-L-arabinose transferase-like glycosyltransferase
MMSPDAVRDATSGRSRRNRTTIALCAVALGALVLRVTGLQYGLPDVYNPDEVAIMARALAFAKGSLNPHNFLYPTFYFYVLFAWVGAYLGFLFITGQVASVAALQRLYFTHPTGIYTAGRALGAVAGAATVLLVHRLTTRLVNRRAGLAAAAFMAAAPLSVRDSHYVKHDVFATMLVVAAYVAFVRVWPAARPGAARGRDVVVAGAACGAAFSTHYYCVFLALPLAWSIIQAWRPLGWPRVAREIVIAGGCAAAVFLALSPFIAVEPVTAWRDIVANRAIVVDRAVAAGAFAPALRYLDIMWHDSMGWPVVMLGCAGAIWMLAVAPARALLLLAFPVPFFAFISNTVPASRYLNPVLPFVAVFAAWALTSLADRLRARPWMFWCAVVACMLPAVAASLRADLFFRQADTRTLAREYIERNIPPGSTVLVQPYSAPLTPSRESVVEALTRHVGSPEAASTKFQLQLSLDPYPSPAYRVIYLGRGGLDVDKIYVDPTELGASEGLTALRRLGVAFVVFKRYNALDQEIKPFVEALEREGRRIAVFSPYRPGVSESERARIAPFLHNTDTRIHDALERPGPPLEIWQIDGAGS